MNKPAGGEGTVAKAIEIVNLVLNFERAVRFSELLEVSPYPKATLHRFLQTLTEQGMLAYDDERQVYVPGLHLARLGYRAWLQSSLAPLAKPYLDALAVDVPETLHLAQMENGRVVFVDKRRSPAQFETLARMGRTAPGHCTGVGKVMMAFMDERRREHAIAQQSFEAFTPHTITSPEALRAELEQIRADGFGHDREEHEQGIISVAVPIFGNGNKVIGALSIVTSTYRMSEQELEGYRPALLRTATQIGREAALWPYPVAY
ncbi:MAG: IclR family transcriptional regulator [Alphaproteobacteria bacterium]|nr:MAG: IclR family transcriptional regulator [Alphaproteobacteria bacterium]